MEKAQKLVRAKGCELQERFDILAKAGIDRKDVCEMRVKVRLLLYNWLKDQGVVEPMLSLSTLITCMDNIFEARYVNLHPGVADEIYEAKQTHDQGA
ncbi:hypothetical protein Patl1_33048 [Pistacia atlantica]|uniref:Uncharacterized protein n=1 Tax=Pistacia atlantica TaxID=434234 RepID=A0ACC1ANP5_9ROSI|nr:hypothetical protein Patl1_33048 [Pistacia atlantica]